MRKPDSRADKTAKLLAEAFDFLLMDSEIPLLARSSRAFLTCLSGPDALSPAVATRASVSA